MMNWKSIIGAGLTAAFLLVSLPAVPALAASEMIPAADSSDKNTNQPVKPDTEKNNPKNNPKQPDEYVPEK
ncbi:hypothetical protein [Sporomusa malonica]|uniref:Uncharacterized protein n=1 Tax=Sporomusa malonica TaxID=112901 RepID=A0A1W2BBJ8_9FIRM|nr:hypothetical protein SAMN04488500_10729 [Sporomusa malonica]